MSDMREGAHAPEAAISDTEFAGRVAGIIPLFEARVLADALGVSVSTPGRWARGQNLPHPLMRSGLWAAMQHLIIGELTALSQRLGLYDDQKDDHPREPGPDRQ
jgi:hypothetical protein